MKKKILGVIALSAIAAIAAFNMVLDSTNNSSDITKTNIEASAASVKSAEENVIAIMSPECPNGCLLNGDVCTCNGDWPDEKEAK